MRIRKYVARQRKRIRRRGVMWPTDRRPLLVQDFNARWRRSAKRITVLWVVKRGQLVAFTLTVEATEASGAGNMASNVSGNIARTETCCPSLCRRRSVHQRSIFQMPLFHFCQLCCFGDRIIEILETIDQPVSFCIPGRSRRGPGRFYQSAPALNDAHQQPA